MVEFGEQLRKAREKKGMTQQTLAEQLFVTRQAVSKWECGDRYPDLPTTKKISEALNVSLDDLLSGKDMNKVIERNSIVDNNLAEKLILAVYAIFLILCLGLIYADVFSLIFICQSNNEFWHFATPSLVQNIIWNIVPKILFSALILFLLYGFIRAAKGTLSPKIVGMIGIVTFATSGMMHVAQIITLNLMQLVIQNLTVYNYEPDIVGAILIPNFITLTLALLPAVIGAISTYFYFIHRSNKNILLVIFIIMVISETIISILSVINWFQTELKLPPYLSLSYFSQLNNLGRMHTYRYTYSIGVYAFLLFQAVALWIKKAKVQNAAKTDAAPDKEATEA